MAAATDVLDQRLDLFVRTLHKTLVLNNVDGKSDVAELKTMLHQRGQEERIPIPVASKQRLVFKGSVLSSGSLQHAGIRSGDHLVLILHRANGLLDDVRPVDATPVPNAATIRAAITAEARRRGIENTLVDEHSRASRMYGMPMEAMAHEYDNQLLQLLQALGGRTAALGGRGGQGRQPAGGGEGVGAQQGQQQEQGDAAGGSGGARRRLQAPAAPFGGPQAGIPAPLGMMLFGMPPQQQQQQQQHPPAPAPAAPPPPAAIPEPDVQAAAQLGEMGFGELVVRKALLLHRNDMEAALNWLLQHGEDPAAAEPLTDEQLRQIYSRGPRGPPSEPELVEQLVAMGFGRNQSAAALRRFRNMDLALAYLLRTADEGGAREEGVAPAAAAGGAGEQEGGQGAAPGQQIQAQEQQHEQQQEQQQRAGSDERGAGEAGAAAAAQGQAPQSPGEGPGQAPRGGRAVGGDSGGGAVDRAASGDLGRGGQRAMEVDGEGGGDQEPPLLGDEGSEEEEDGEGRHDEEGQVEDYEGEGEQEDDGMAEDEDEEDDDEDDEFTGDDDMPTMIEQLAMGQGAGPGRTTVLHVPLGGGGLAGGGGMADDGMGGFGAPFVFFGGGPHGVGGPGPAVTVTRGPDGNDLVLGSSGGAMPPLMPARGVMLAQPGGEGHGLMLGGGGGAGPHLMDLPGLLPGMEAGDEGLVAQGLMQQLLSAVLRDALSGGGEGGQGGAGLRR